MSLHRLLGFHVDLPSPDGLVALYGELGLDGDATSGFTGSDGGGGHHPRRRPVPTAPDGPGRLRPYRRPRCHRATPRAGWRLGRAVRNGCLRGGAGHQGALLGRGRRAGGRPETLRRSSSPTLPAPWCAPTRRAPAVFEAARPPRRLGHLVLGSPDVERTVALLVDGIGFKVSGLHSRGSWPFSVARPTTTTWPSSNRRSPCCSTMHSSATTSTTWATRRLRSTGPTPSATPGAWGATSPDRTSTGTWPIPRVPSSSSTRTSTRSSTTGVGPDGSHRVRVRAHRQLLGAEPPPRVHRPERPRRAPTGMGVERLTTSSCDLLVIGFGPVGAVLAGLAARRGLSVTVVEREAGLFPLPRAVQM